MSIGGIGSVFNAKTDYVPARTRKNTVENNYALQQNNVQRSKMSSGSFELHYFDNEKGERAISASCGTDYSVTVYEPEDYDPSNPIYKVKLWDKDGNVTERMVDVSKVDPKNSDYIDMYAYACYASKTGICKDALSAFMGADAGCYGNEGRTYKDLFTYRNWVEAVEDMMKTQYDAGNLPGYLNYKQFYDFLIKGNANKKASEEENVQSKENKEKESESRTEVVVKADGSRVLMITTQMGEMQTTTSVELSKPAPVQNKNLQDGSIINDSVRNTAAGDINAQDNGSNNN